MSKLDVLIQSFNKTYGSEIALKGSNKEYTEIKIPFSSPRANYCLYGGLPRGRIIEFAGEENSGKTTTALDIVANAQKLFIKEYNEELNKLEQLNNVKKPKKEDINKLEQHKQTGIKKVVYADCENTLDERWAMLLGVNLNEMYVIKPIAQTAEQIFEMILQMIDTEEVGLVVIDSLGVLLSAQAYEKTMEEKTYGGIASALTLFSKKAEYSCSKTNCTLIGINQVREDLNSPYGGLTTTGGKAWRHNCSLRLMFRKGSFIDDKNNEIKRSSESPAGNLVQIEIAKTKVCKPDRRLGFYTLKYNTGVDIIQDTIDLAIKYNYIQQAGSWYSIVDTDTGEVMQIEGEQLKIQGLPQLHSYLSENEQVFNKLYNQVTSY